MGIRVCRSGRLAERGDRCTTVVARRLYHQGPATAGRREQGLLRRLPSSAPQTAKSCQPGAPGNVAPGGGEAGKQQDFLHSLL